MKLGTVVVIDNSPVEIGEVVYSSDGASVLNHAAEGRLAIFFPELDEMRLYKNNSPKIKTTYDSWDLCFINEPQMSPKLQQMYVDSQRKRLLGGHVHNIGGIVYHNPPLPRLNTPTPWVNYEGLENKPSALDKVSSAKQCTCPISELMARGCRCGYLNKT